MPPSRTRARLPPVDPLRFVPTRERPVRAKSRQLKRDTEITPHSHAWAQVVVCASGVARITAGHSTYPAAWRAVGSAADRAPGHRRRGRRAAHAVRAPGRRPLTARAFLPRAGGNAAAQLVLQMDVDGGGADGRAALERERRLGELSLDELCRAAPVRLGVDLPQDKRLRTLCEAVLRDPSRHATLEGWARETAASPRTVARLFRQQLDTSFGPWRQQVLLAHALRLAAQGRPMGLIAAELGYASPSAFSAMVRRAVGQPPSRFFATA